MAEAGSTQLVKIVSSDNVEYHVPRNIIALSEVIKGWLEIHDRNHEGTNYTETIRLQNITDLVLRKVIQWCEHYVDAAPRRHNELTQWDIAFFHVPYDYMLCELIQAATYLDIETLQSAGCQFISNILRPFN